MDTVVGFLPISGSDGSPGKSNLGPIIGWLMPIHFNNCCLFFLKLLDGMEKGKEKCYEVQIQC